MEEVDKGWMMIRIGEWVNVSYGTGSPRCRQQGHVGGSKTSLQQNSPVLNSSNGVPPNADCPV